ncbi:uncharacterized protein LOC143377938 [Andrena cerasifolii]|uniref:uncharacterized protein LOC143377938 n=1 Tax=Andrena cerasifolii TaxID=2819439 RepID=UPI004037B9C1
MLSRYVTSIVSNLLRSPSSLWKIEPRRFHGTSLMHQKKKRNARSFLKKKEPEGPKIIKPGNCAGSPKSILEPSCKIAVIIGGSDGFGFAAADHLLCKGARVSTLPIRSLRFFFVYRVNVYVYFNSNSIIFTPEAGQWIQNIVIVDSDTEQGQTAARRLCDSYGWDRVQFLECDVKNVRQFEATLRQAVCKHKEIHILFNDLDKESFSTNCNKSEKKEKLQNNAARAIQIGLNIMGKNHGGPGGIIVNCASIFGFMGWPLDPFPIYCKKEPAIEITMDFAKEYKVEETGVRLVALCPANKQFSDIGLPDFPDPLPKECAKELPPCTPTTKYQVGSALTYVMAWARSGSTWLVEPATSVHEIPRLIHFPSKQGEKVDPKVYETQPCTVKLEPPCAKVTDACPSEKKPSCDTDPPKKK